ncbi:hypothetical protein [Desulfotalea psychrophila]|uniref:Glycosyl transferase family 28 C-terminal domain-containing protein n=1 Tax=Desulfotalea psychrophila (strain LSv54 / DSM 12343) TaxID=177439 RepID=Q6AQM5_DESPS|nr:hypothetical protein [Desulfotalea psychrophila]CAG35348.1 hypothetical protein DP0619 [Desulfotalea psychrophila LSv54]
MPQLDILIYAHDGRGLGHASRSIAIGSALRRLAPDAKVLFVSGCAMSGELIADAPLDWCKLPSYKTMVVDGKSRGIRGESGFTDEALGLLRARQLQSLVEVYRPRIVLVDHAPQGKHRELLPALESEAGQAAHWLLGVRGVVGGVNQTLSDYPARIFSRYYKSLLWYGDRAVLGEGHLQTLKDTYGQEAQECGYVSRFFEQGQQTDVAKSYAGVISIPWLGEHSLQFLQALLVALENVGGGWGPWRIFMDGEGSPEAKRLYAGFAALDHCRVEPPGRAYLQALTASRIAVIYGGYNSLVDLLSLRIPALVCLRAMRDREQQIHLQSLQENVAHGFQVFAEEEVTAEELQTMLLVALQEEDGIRHEVRLSGADRAAEIMLEMLSYS